MESLIASVAVCLARRTGLVGVALLSLVFIASSCFAGVGSKDAAWGLDHFQHTPYTATEGAPEGVTSLVQTTDGYLWVGGSEGLASFDGLKFVPFKPRERGQLLSTQIYTLFADHGGGLWIGYDGKGISHLKDGRLKHYGSAENYQLTVTTQIFESSRGTVFAIGRGPFSEFQNGHWREVFPTSNLAITAATIDRSSTLWLGGIEKIFWSREGSDQMVDAGFSAKSRIISLAVVDSVLYVTELSGPTRRLQIDGTKLHELPSLPVRTVAPLLDRHGGLWAPTLGAGVRRISAISSLNEPADPSAASDTFSKGDGLTGDYAWPSLLDKEGDVWIGTQFGVDRFRETSFVNVRLPDGIQSPAVSPGEPGAVWIGSSEMPVMHLANGQLRSTAVPAYTFAKCFDESTGNAWAANDGLWLLDPKQPRRVESNPAKKRVIALSLACGEHGHMLVVFQTLIGVYERLNGQWRERPDLEHPLVIESAGGERFFLGYPENRFAIVDGSVVQRYQSADGLHVGDVTSFATFGKNAFVGGLAGLALLKDGRVHALQSSDDPPLSNITGLAQDLQGNLWIHMSAGAARIDREDVAHILADPDYRAPYKLFDSTDGLRGVPAQHNALPSLIRDGEGKLWFSSQARVAWLDPQDMVRNTVRPKVAVTKVIAEGATYEPQGYLKLPRVRNIEIDFNAPLLRAPERAQFQYRMDGVDKGWQDAGARRAAFYTNLSPGTHDFRVRVANESDVWGEASADIRLDIAHAFYEDWKFRAACLGLAMSLLWLLVHLRIHKATERLKAQLEIRADEREAVARDIHDTFLQSAQSIALQLDVLGTTVSDTDLKSRIFRLSAVARDSLEESRDRIRLLRDHALVAKDPLTNALNAAQAHATEHGIELVASLTGQRRSVTAAAADELVPVIHELVLNACRHAQASRIDIAMLFGMLSFVLIVRDDGIGLGEQVIKDGAPQGHWGIQGVKERVARIGGSVRFERLTPHGTRVVIRIPARRMYARN